MLIGKIRHLESGEEREITFTRERDGKGYYLTPQQYHLIGHAPFMTEEWELIALNGEYLNPDTGTYYSEREGNND